ncbi:ATP-dependent zinc protease family protein [Halomonas getboli]|uniref:ATP-dependent zinc protease family protein n=1 Tax=Halomonas getboli TaxID=2935862 RepID=UPI001FFF6AAA|nr:ATP-dependent zinc protease [Halomonas getboli]MCK2183167.1 ATP-dependent zinc protease [Halomonas getboli]
MPIRPLLIAPLAALLSLGGCGLVPQHEAPPEPVSQQAFADRIDRLEADLAARCDVRQQALGEQRQEQLGLRADVREVGYLLRGVRSDLQALSGDAQQESTTSSCPTVDERLENKTLVGSSEWVGLPEVGTYLEARIDSGATTSSLSATDITPFERDGEDWVRFKLGLNDQDDVVASVRDKWIEVPVERRVKIIQANGEESRPVISLLMTLGPLHENVEFTLSDRTNLDYPMLLGRRFLMDIAIIDVARRHIYDRPDFPTPSAAEADDAPETQDETTAP